MTYYTLHRHCAIVYTLIVLLLYLSQCNGNSFDHLTFTPIYGKSHKWDYACQRFVVERNATVIQFDIDYQRVTKKSSAATTTQRLIFSKKNHPTNTFIAYGVLLSNSTTTSDNWLYNNYTMTPLDFVTGMKQFQVTSDMFVSLGSSEAVLVVFAELIDNGTTRNILYEQYITFSDTGLYNRSQCYDLMNYHHYVREYYLNDCRIAFIVHSIFMVPMLIMFLLSVVTCRGHLAKRRSPTSIIGNVSMLFVFVVSLPAYNGVSFNLYKHSIRAELSLYGWYTYCQVIGIIIGLVTAVTSYLATMLRYFHLRLMYRLSFSAVSENQKQQEVPRWKKIVLSKWFYWPMFFLCTALLYVVLAGVTLGLRYAHVKYLIIYTALDILDIDFLVVLGILLLIYCIDMLVHIKKFKKGPIYFFWVHDPLLFRLEALIAAVFFAAMTIGIVVYFKYPALYPYARAICFDVAYFFALPLFGNGLITLIQVYRYIIKCVNPSNQQENEKDMLILLADDEFYSLFQKYCQKEFSSENLVVFSMLDKLKNKGTMDFESFDHLYQTYIRSGSNFELNLPSALQQECSKLHLEKSEKKQSVEYQQLHNLFMEVISNLEDTYNRFKSTTVFSVYIQEKQAFQKEFHLETIPTTTTKAVEHNQQTNRS
jgi:hypothetical protein